MTNTLKLYWDSCVFLKYLNDEPGSDIIESLLADAEAGKVTIYTSTITIAEVTHAKHEREQSHLDSEIENILKGLFANITFAEYSENIGYTTRDLIRKMIASSQKLKSKDGIHLATALWIDHYIVRLTEINTYDKELQTFYPGIIQIRITEPHRTQLPLL